MSLLLECSSSKNACISRGIKTTWKWKCYSISSINLFRYSRTTVTRRWRNMSVLLAFDSDSYIWPCISCKASIRSVWSRDNCWETRSIIPRLIISREWTIERERAKRTSRMTCLEFDIIVPPKPRMNCATIFGNWFNSSPWFTERNDSHKIRRLQQVRWQVKERTQRVLF